MMNSQIIKMHNIDSEEEKELEHEKHKFDLSVRK